MTKRYVDENGKRWGVHIDDDVRRFRVELELDEDGKEVVTDRIGAEIVPTPLEEKEGEPEPGETEGDIVDDPVENVDDLDEEV